MIGHVYVYGRKVERTLAKTGEGVYYREGTSDIRTLGEIERSYGWVDVRERRVLDIGAHIGGFSAWAIRHGASSIISVEPDECNYDLLKMNVLHTDTEIPTLINAAVVPTNDPTTVLWYPPRGVSHGLLSTHEFRGRYAHTVPAISFKELLSMQPEVIKVDCEGAEYQFEIDGTNLPDSVREVCIEIHLTKRDWRVILAPDLIKSFSGWETVRKPRIGIQNWATIAGWRR
jgi:FkbM family methyltransferase